MTSSIVQDTEVPPPYFSIASPPPPADGLSDADALAHDTPALVSTPIPGPRSHSPPPSYDAVVPTSPVSPTSVGWQSPRQHRRLSAFALPFVSGSHRSSTTGRAPAPPTRAVSEETTLESIFETHPWRRAWGARPRTLDSALIKACLNGAEPLAGALLACGASVRFTGRYAASWSTSAVHEALRGPTPELALVLMSHVFSTTYAAALPPGSAAAPVSAADEQRAMEAGDERTRCVLDARDEKGCTPLHLAAQAGEADIAEAMVLRGAEVDAEDEFGRTPLHMAARYNRLDAARLLIRCGADANRITEQPWMSAGPRAEELGSYGMIIQVLSNALEEERDALYRGGDDLELSLTRSRRSSTSAASPRAPAGKNVSSSGPKPIESFGEPYTAIPTSPPISPRRAPRPGPNAFSSRSSESWTNQPILSPDVLSVLTTSLSSLGRAAPAIRRPPPSMWNTPEYVIWRRDCELLQAEHRAQKEKNRRSGAT